MVQNKILLADDEPNVTAALKHTLRREHYDILTANSGPEALEIMRCEPVDVLVTDEKMPGMSGTLLLAVVRRDYPETIGIMLTGHATLEVAVQAINHGEIYRFLMKPCNGAELSVAIRQALQHKQLVAESRKLLKISRQQAEFINEMEAAYPGITHVKRDAQGAIMIDGPAENVDDLIQEMSAEVNKSERFYMDWG